MTATAQLPMSTKELTDRLQRHYIKPSEPLPGGVFVPECGWNGGRNVSRCDALYIGFTSASGRNLIGHELKVSRSDWRHELDKPGKADAWHDQCHAWYVVAPSTDIVPPEELPDGWGLMVVNPRSKVRLDTVVKARYYPERQPSWNAVRSIFGRLDSLRANLIQEEIYRARQTATAAVEKQYADRRREHELPRDVQDRLSALDQLEAKLGGVSISTFARGDALRPEVAARLVKLAQAGHDLEVATNRSTRHYELARVEEAAQNVIDSLAAFREAAKVVQSEQAAS